MGNFITYPQIQSTVRSVPSAPGYLLDTYSGAALAYALRKLTATPPTNCIRVRRSSDSTEQNIGYSGDWIDEAALLTFCGSGDGFVVTWYDQSGNSMDVTNATATQQPQIVSAGVVIRQGIWPAVSFDGSSDRLVGPSNTLFSNVPGVTAFVVARHKSPPTATRSIAFVAAAASVGTTRIGVGGAVGGVYSMFGRRLDANSNQMVSSTSLTDCAFNVMHTALFDYANSDAFLYINGALAATTTTFQTSGNTESTTSQAIALGGGGAGADLAHVNLSEAILFNSNQSSNIAAIESAINYYHKIY